MSREFLKQQEKILIEMQDKLERQLESFAKKDENLDHNWKSDFPKLDKSAIGDANLETAQDEVEEYMNRLSLEHTLEIKLRNVVHALERIKEGKYGRCEKCNKKIPLDRLKVCPEARWCLDCEKK